MDHIKPDGNVDRTDYFYKGENYVVGLTASIDEKRHWGIIASKLNADGKFGKSRICKEFCFYTTHDEAQRFLDDYAKIVGFQVW